MVPFGPREVLSFPGETEDEMKLYTLTKDGLEVFRKVTQETHDIPKNRAAEFSLESGNQLSERVAMPIPRGNSNSKKKKEKKSEKEGKRKKTNI